MKILCDFPIYIFLNDLLLFTESAKCTRQWEMIHCLHGVKWIWQPIEWFKAGCFINIEYFVRKMSKMLNTKHTMFYMEISFIWQTWIIIVLEIICTQNSAVLNTFCLFDVYSEPQSRVVPPSPTNVFDMIMRCMWFNLQNATDKWILICIQIYSDFCYME